MDESSTDLTANLEVSQTPASVVFGAMLYLPTISFKVRVTGGTTSLHSIVIPEPFKHVHVVIDATSLYSKKEVLILLFIRKTLETRLDISIQVQHENPGQRWQNHVTVNNGFIHVWNRKMSFMPFIQSKNWELFGVRLVIHKREPWYLLFRVSGPHLKVGMREFLRN